MAEQVIQITNYGTAAGRPVGCKHFFWDLLRARKIAGGVRFQTHAWRNLESSG